MAEFLPPVILEIQANATKAIAQMQAVNGELDKMEVKAVKAGGSIDVMTKASKYAGTALLGIAGVLGTVGAMSIKAALSVQVSQSKLQTAVQDTGVSFQKFIPFMNQAQDSMAKLGFGAEDTNQALATLTAATRNPATAIQNMGVVADLAAFKNESLAAAADTVARATMGQARGLADLGLAIGKTIPKGADLATITQMVENRVHGAAQAAANANPWKVLTTQFGVMEEKLGTALLPMFKKLSDWIINTGLPALEKIGKWISQNQGLFETLAGTLAALWVAPKIDALIAAIGTIAEAWTGVATAAGAATAAELGAEAAGGAGAAGAAADAGATAGAVEGKAGKFGTEAALVVGGALVVNGLMSKYGPTIFGGPNSPSAKKYAAGLQAATVPVSQQPVGPAVTYMSPAGTNPASIMSGLNNVALPGPAAGSFGAWLQSGGKTPWKTSPLQGTSSSPSKSTILDLSNINSGLSNSIIASKGKAVKKPTIAQQRNGILSGSGVSGNLTITVKALPGTQVGAITGANVPTKAVVRK